MGTLISGNVAISRILATKPDAEMYLFPVHHTVSESSGSAYNIESIPRMLSTVKVLKSVVYFR